MNQSDVLSQGSELNKRKWEGQMTGGTPPPAPHLLLLSKSPDAEACWHQPGTLGPVLCASSCPSEISVLASSCPH